MKDGYRAPQTACYECKNRHYACHDTCEIYQKARNEWIERKKTIRRNKGLYYSLNKYEVTKTEQLKRRYRT